MHPDMTLTEDLGYGVIALAFLLADPELSG